MANTRTTVTPSRQPLSGRLKFTSTSYPSTSLNFLKKLDTTPHFLLNGPAAETAVPQAPLSLDILIVGAGLGGLATATALARRGHKVTVFEQAPILAEVGAGIQIPPNSGKLLHRWGVMDSLLAQAVQPDGISFRRWESGARIGFTDLTEEFRATHGAPYYVVHRAHLHTALLERARALGVEVRLGSKVIEYDQAAARIKLAGGEAVQGDLVVAADGIKSVAREYVATEKSAAPVKTGYAAYRATVDVEKMRKIPELSWILEKAGLNVWIGENRHVMTYTIASGQSFNMVLSHRDESDPATWAQKSQDVVLREMRNEFQGWDPQLLKIIDLIETTLKWPLVEGGTVHKWLSPSSRLLILGDAAHGMLPYMSQGAAMAVEDGAALAVALSSISSRDELSFALAAFEAERGPRTRMMQEASRVNAMLWHFPDGPEQNGRDEAMRAEVERRPFLSSPNQWSDPATQMWAYSYDAEEAMAKRWEGAVKELIGKAKM